MAQLCSRCKKRPAVVFITRIEGDKSTPEGLCLKCARELKIKPISDMLDQMNISDDDLENMTGEMMNMFGMGGEDSPEGMENGDGDSPDGFMPGGAAFMPPFLKNLFGGGENAQNSVAEGEENAGNGTSGTDEKTGKKDKKKSKEKKRKFLSAYCTNLTAKAKNGETDRIIGRDRELYRVIQILLRRQKNNPCLIGEPGVGKTAIAEGLAQKIAEGDVPAKLLDKEIFLLDMTALVAGTQFRGQFESRIKGLIDEVKSNGNIILFIDEVHTLVGTGDAEGSMNAANILKPALSRGEIQVIGATTFNEYRKHIEKDAALERRFQPVTVEEPSIENTIKILTGIKEYYEKFHNIVLPDALISRAVRLSERYITDRFLPDKAIDLIDEACASAALRNKAADSMIISGRKIDEMNEELETIEGESSDESGAPDYEKIANMKAELARLKSEYDEYKKDASSVSVTDDDLARVIELWTGIPAAKVRQSDLQRLAGLEKRLGEKIIGQDEAIKLVSNAVRRSRVHISPGRRPASFIFAGPTGVGKTEMVKVLAAELFDTPETLIRLDMSEFMEKHSVSRIIGSPPGYVGYDEAGQLTEKVRRKPYSVLLFDEIEKAHPDVMNVLLQILDDGRITDAHGRTVNFENTIIVMTTNAGSENKTALLGFGKDEKTASSERTMKALREFLRPEFIGRVDEVVCFNPLTRDDFVKIAALMLGELKGSLAERTIDFEWDNDGLLPIADEAYGKERGARDLRNVIRRKVEDRIAEIMVERCDDAPTKFFLTKDGEITYEQ